MTMKPMMVKVFVIITFALLLALPVHSEHEFGDLIIVEMDSIGNLSMPIYIHWTLYVGTNTVEGLENIKKKDEDIFHIYGRDITEVPYCVFGKLAEIPGKPVKLNPDKDRNGKSLSVVKRETMIKKIKKLLQKCTWWDPVLKSCEHVLFYVRYEETIECKLEDSRKTKPKRSPSFHMA